MIAIQSIHGGDLAAFGREYPGAPVLDFSANLNPLGMPDSVREAIAASADGCLRYPDPDSRALREALAAYEGVPRGWILPGNGAADLIYRIAYGLRPRKALLLAPAFAEYELALAASGCAPSFHALREEDGFRLDEGILGEIPGKDLVLLANPNNPNGGLAGPGLMAEILHRCRENGAVLAVDECFLDFVSDPERHGMKRYLGDGGLLILKAFTKSFAVPGVRLGYLLSADQGMLERIRAAGPPWPVSVPAGLAGIAAAKETGWMDKTRPLIATERERLRQGLAEPGYRVYPSQANFLLFRGEPGLAEALRPLGILLRDCGSFRGLCAGYYRAAVRLPEENGRLIQAIKTLR